MYKWPTLLCDNHYPDALEWRGGPPSVPTFYRAALAVAALQQCKLHGGLRRCAVPNFFTKATPSRHVIGITFQRVAVHQCVRIR